MGIFRALSLISKKSRNWKRKARPIFRGRAFGDTFLFNIPQRCFSGIVISCANHVVYIYRTGADSENITENFIAVSNKRKKSSLLVWYLPQKFPSFCLFDCLFVYGTGKSHQSSFSPSTSLGWAFRVSFSELLSRRCTRNIVIPATAAGGSWKCRKSTTA